MDNNSNNSNISNGPGGPALTVGNIGNNIMSMLTGNSPTGNNPSTISSNTANDNIGSLNNTLSGYTQDGPPLYTPVGGIGTQVGNYIFQGGGVWSPLNPPTNNNERTVNPGSSNDSNRNTSGNANAAINPNAQNTLNNASPAQTYQPTPEGNQYLSRLDNYMNQMNGLYSRVDTNYNNELSQINAQMGMLKAKQTAENEAYAAGIKQSGLASGMAMLTPEITKSNVHQAVQQGIQKLQDLTTQQNGLILAANKANIAQKVDILGKLQDIDTQKYNTARQMKEDFYTNLKNQQEQEKIAANKAILSNYTYLRNLTPEQRKTQLGVLAHQAGLSTSDMMSYFSAYDKEEQKQVTDMRTQLLSKLGISADYETLNASTADFQKFLNSQPLYKSYVLSQQLDNTLKQAQINTENAKTAPGIGGKLTDKQKTVFNSMVAKFNTAPVKQAYDNTSKLKAVVAALEEDPTNSRLQQTFIYQFINGLDNTAVREGEIKLLKSTQGLLDKAQNLAPKIFHGTVLSKNAIKDYMAAAKLITEATESAAKQKANEYTAQARVNGFNDTWMEYLQSPEIGLYQNGSGTGYQIGTDTIVITN